MPIVAIGGVNQWLEGFCLSLFSNKKINLKKEKDLAPQPHGPLSVLNLVHTKTGPCLQARQAAALSLFNPSQISTKSGKRPCRWFLKLINIRDAPTELQITDTFIQGKQGQFLTRNF